MVILSGVKLVEALESLLRSKLSFMLPMPTYDWANEEELSPTPIGLPAFRPLFLLDDYLEIEENWEIYPSRTLGV